MFDLEGMGSNLENSLFVSAYGGKAVYLPSSDSTMWKLRAPAPPPPPINS